MESTPVWQQLPTARRWESVACSQHISRAACIHVFYFSLTGFHSQSSRRTDGESQRQPIVFFLVGERYQFAEHGELYHVARSRKAPPRLRQRHASSRNAHQHTCLRRGQQFGRILQRGGRRGALWLWCFAHVESCRSGMGKNSRFLMPDLVCARRKCIKQFLYKESNVL